MENLTRGHGISDIFTLITMLEESLIEENIILISYVCLKDTYLDLQKPFSLFLYFYCGAGGP